MSPAPSFGHQTLVVEVLYQLRAALRGKSCTVLVAPMDVLLGRSDIDDGSIDTVVQPDVFVVRDPTKLRPRHVRGASDWVLEVVSPSSASHDQIVKLAAYEKAGVREYWIAHPTIAYSLSIDMTARGVMLAQKFASSAARRRSACSKV